MIAFGKMWMKYFVAGHCDFGRVWRLLEIGAAIRRIHATIIKVNLLSDDFRNLDLSPDEVG